MTKKLKFHISNAHFPTHSMCSTIMEFRKANLEAFQKKYGIKLGFMSVFSKASAYALQDQPVVNAVIDGSVSAAAMGTSVSDVDG